MFNTEMTELKWRANQRLIQLEIFHLEGNKNKQEQHLKNVAFYILTQAQ